MGTFHFTINFEESYLVPSLSTINFWESYLQFLPLSTINFWESYFQFIPLSTINSWESYLQVLPLSTINIEESYSPFPSAIDDQLGRRSIAWEGLRTVRARLAHGWLGQSLNASAQYVQD